VDVLVGGAVERADVGRGLPAAGADAVREEHRRRRLVGLAAGREPRLPPALDAVDVADDAAILALVGVRARAALLRERGVAAAAGDTRAVERLQGARETSAAADEADEEVDDEPDDAKAAAADGEAAAREPETATPAGVLDLRGIEPGAGTESNHRLSLSEGLCHICGITVAWLESE